MASTKQTAARQRGAEDVMDKVQQLVSLATKNDNENEAAAAAMKAVQLMSEHRLTVIPQEDLEAAQRVINGAQELVKKAEEKANNKLLMGIVIGKLLGGTGKLF